MKANELRLQNIIKYTTNKDLNPFLHGEYLKVDIDTLMYIESDNRPDFYEPIPLTTEVLKKCGFEYVTDWTVPDKRKHDCVTFLDLGYMYLASGMMGGGVTLFQNDRRSTGTNIEYLHQLQNLYFALTGEELEVKL